MAVQVTIEDHTGNTTREAKLEENVLISRLIPALITALKFPITDNSGRPITYHLSYNNRRLNENETLASAGVQTGQTLTFLPEITAGLQVLAQDVLPPPVIVQSTLQKQPIQGFPPEYQTGLQDLKVHVTLLPQTLEKIWSHTKAHLQQEVGGFLFGKAYQENGRFLVHVKHVLEARYTVGRGASLTFTNNTWLDMLQQRQAYPDLLTLGWYHSHPHMGIFFSFMDQFVHRHFFGNQPWYIALVVDPSSDEWGLFTWDNGTIGPYLGI